MKFGILQMHRDEYANGNRATRDYYVTFFGIPIYSARFTSTNSEAIAKLTITKSSIHVCGFTINK